MEHRTAQVAAQRALDAYQRMLVPSRDAGTHSMHVNNKLAPKVASEPQPQPKSLRAVTTWGALNMWKFPISASPQTSQLTGNVAHKTAAPALRKIAPKTTVTKRKADMHDYTAKRARL